MHVIPSVLVWLVQCMCTAAANSASSWQCWVLSALRHHDVRLQGLGQEAIEELTLSDPRTGQTYDDDAAQIARNSSVVVKRTPGLKPNALQAGSGITASGAPAAAAPAPKLAEDQAAGQAAAPAANGATGESAFGALYSEQAVPEAVPAAEDEMQALLQQANDSWRQEMAESARATYGRGRGGRFGGRGDAGRFGSGGRGGYTTPRLHAGR